MFNKFIIFTTKSKKSHKAAKRKMIKNPKILIFYISKQIFINRGVPNE